MDHFCYLCFVPYGLICSGRSRFSLAGVIVIDCLIKDLASILVHVQLAQCLSHWLLRVCMGA